MFTIKFNKKDIIILSILISIFIIYKLCNKKTIDTAIIHPASF